jgi:hypothetical protein
VEALEIFCAGQRTITSEKTRIGRRISRYTVPARTFCAGEREATMAIGPVNTPPVPPSGPSDKAAELKGAANADVSKFQGLTAKGNQDPGKMSVDELKSEIKTLNEKASRYPGLDDEEKKRLALCTSELSTKMAQESRTPQSSSPGGSILDKMK